MLRATAIGTRMLTRHLTSQGRQPSKVAPARQQLFHIRNKAHHGACSSNSIKGGRAPPQSHRGRLACQVGTVEPHEADTFAVLADEVIRSSGASRDITGMYTKSAFACIAVISNGIVTTS